MNMICKILVWCISRQEIERRRRLEVEQQIARTREATRLAEEQRRKMEEQRILAR